MKVKDALNTQKWLLKKEHFNVYYRKKLEWLFVENLEGAFLQIYLQITLHKKESYNIFFLSNRLISVKVQINQLLLFKQRLILLSSRTECSLVFYLAFTCIIFCMKNVDIT